MPRILYLAPDYDRPSWGVALLYHHVRLLRGLGFDASVLHESGPFRLSWLDVDVPIVYLDGGIELRDEDVVVVPEVNAPAALGSHACRRVVFVQGGFLLLAGADRAFEYPELGYEAGMVTMPHLRTVVSDHFGLTPAVVPPFVAPYFFVADDTLEAARRRRVLMACKPEYGKAGYLDHEIAQKLLLRHFARLAARTGDAPWELVVLEGLRHVDMAAAMKQAAFLVNLNSLEGFNVSVAEAMAAGCVAVCYEAFGGQDYLVPRENAIVFPNNYVYPLVSAMIDLTEHYDARTRELELLRRRALATARTFNGRRTAEALGHFFGRLLA